MVALEVNIVYNNTDNKLKHSSNDYMTTPSVEINATKPHLPSG